MQWPEGWFHAPQEHTLTPTKPGTAISHIQVASPQSYELWLAGSFGRGFEVSVDGEHVGTVKNQLLAFEGYMPVADMFLAPGVHAFEFTYPHSNLAPGSGLGEFTFISAIALEPQQSPPREMLTVPPAQAKNLCGRTLDWIEIVR
jgi:hypothetical protein